MWLVTDARTAPVLPASLRALPRGAGVIFRHYHLAPAERRAAFAQVLRRCRARGLVAVIALEMGGSSDLCAHLQPGEPVVLMGPTGAPSSTAISDDERSRSLVRTCVATKSSVAATGTKYPS